MDQPAQGPVIFAIGVGCVEARESTPAKTAPAILIQRKCIQKRSVALDAEIRGIERLWRGKTRSTNRDSRNFPERRAADSAIVWEDKVKHGRRKSPCGELVDIRQNSE